MQNVVYNSVRNIVWISNFQFVIVLHMDMAWEDVGQIDA